MNKISCRYRIAIITILGILMMSNISCGSDSMENRGRSLMKALNVEKTSVQQSLKQSDKIFSEKTFQRLGNFAVTHKKPIKNMDGIVVKNINLVDKTGKIQILGKVLEGKTSQSTRTAFFDQLAMNSLPMNLLIQKFKVKTDGIGDLCIVEMTYDKKAALFVIDESKMHFIRGNIAVSLKSKDTPVKVKNIAKLIDEKLSE